MNLTKPKRPTSSYLKFRSEWILEDNKMNPEEDPKKIQKFELAWQNIDPSKKE
jgi:hypothetical protein